MRRFNILNSRNDEYIRTFGALLVVAMAAICAGDVMAADPLADMGAPVQRGLETVLRLAAVGIGLTGLVVILRKFMDVKSGRSDWGDVAGSMVAGGLVPLVVAGFVTYFQTEIAALTF